MAHDDLRTAPGVAARGSSDNADPYVVGIGASAGGLAALRTLLGAMPRAPGFACVIVVHLAPHHESHLVELLQPYTRMRVQQVRETTRLEANNVYVIPPNANLEAIDTHLRLSPLESRRVERAPIDHFLRTLARAHDGRALGVILTGSGSDGSLGLRQIKERGGLTIAQDPAEAEYDSMPRSAIQTAAVDRVLRLRDIPAAIMSFCAAEPRLALEDVVDPYENIAVEEVVALLHARTGHDFKHFRRSVMLRKIGRRMQLRRVGTVEGYLDTLRSLDDEAHALCNDLLFTVTDFFDDQALFSRIEREILPALFAQKNVAGARVRAWTIGCSTGEEAYSIAMLLAEQLDGRPDPPALQVFASDLSPETLAQAREGVYPHEVAATVSQQRLDRFFTEQGDCYRIADQLRGLVVFAAHNVLRDPPYAHVDLIICRGLLSELRPEVRSAVLGMFHYALEPDGWLIVGARDEIEEPLLFEYEDRRAGILKRLPGASRADPARRLLAGGASLERGQRWYRQFRPCAGPGARVSSLSHDGAVYPAKLTGLRRRHGGVLLAIGGSLRLHAGRRADARVFRLLCAPLPIPLRGLIERSRREAVTRISEPFTVETESGLRRVVLRVEPPGRDSAGLTLVVIDELRDPVTESDTAPAAIVSALQAEIDRIEQHLRDVLEQHAEDGERGTAASDDLQSTNQELRFILEQLESSKEETQVANEELTTLNIENRQRVDELGKLSSVLRHLLQSTGIATLFLDTDLRIVRFTPQLGEIFNMREVDVGRPVAEITNRLEYGELVEDARRTLDHLTSVEREVYSKTGRWYLTRMLPYRAPTERVEGVVVTFIDITDRKNGGAGASRRGSAQGRVPRAARARAAQSARADRLRNRLAEAGKGQPPRARAGHGDDVAPGDAARAPRRRFAGAISRERRPAAPAQDARAATRRRARRGRERAAAHRAAAPRAGGEVARGADRARSRQRAAHAGVREPSEQRRALHARGRAHQHRSGAPGPGGGRHGQRQRHRHPRAGDGADLRDVLPRRGGAPEPRRRARHRPHAREISHRDAWRHDHGRERGATIAAASSRSGCPPRNSPWPAKGKSREPPTSRSAGIVC